MSCLCFEGCPFFEKTWRNTGDGGSDNHVERCSVYDIVGCPFKNVPVFYEGWEIVSENPFFSMPEECSWCDQPCGGRTWDVNEEGHCERGPYFYQPPVWLEGPDEDIPF